MNAQKKIGVAALAMMLSATTGGVLAENSSDKSDRESCMQEAEEAGMVNEDDVSAYIDQCLEELRIRNGRVEPDYDEGLDF